MHKVSEILQHGLNQVKAGHDLPYTGMCIIVGYMVGTGSITVAQSEETEAVITHAREEQGLSSYAYLVSALRRKHKLDSGDKQLELLWIKWYEDLIAEIQAKGK